MGEFDNSININVIVMIRIRLDLVKYLMIKTSEKSWTQCFDDSLSSLSSEKRIKFLFFLHLKMMTWSHQNVVSNSLRLFLIIRLSWSQEIISYSMLLSYNNNIIDIIITTTILTQAFGVCKPLTDVSNGTCLW